MTTLQQSSYLTATSLTARQINRRIILNIIHKNQPVSRADAARITGLQRSTVSLIVDELINEGWIVEGEFGRIPRGRRPVYLYMNVDSARMFGLHITDSELYAATADLNGKILSTAGVELQDLSTASLRVAVDAVKEKMKDSLGDLPVKGVGVAFNAFSRKANEVQKDLEEILETCVVLDSVAVACGEWFLLTNKDAKQAEGHLVTIYAGEQIETGVSIAGRTLRGVNGKAGTVLNGDNGRKVSANDLADRLEFAISAYDPGIILITGPFADHADDVRPALEQRLQSLGSSPEILRIIETGAKEESVYLNGAVALILSHYLTECPV